MRILTGCVGVALCVATFVSGSIAGCVVDHVAHTLTTSATAAAIAAHGASFMMTGSTASC